MQPRKDIYEDYETWNHTEIRLNHILRKSVEKLGLEEKSLKKYFTSATEQEIENGAFEVLDAQDHVYCFFREINNLYPDISTKDFIDVDVNIGELDKYSLWDMLDDLQDMFEYGREDFDFVYYIYLDKLISKYMRYIKYPYNKKAILGNISSPIVRKKYLLKNLPDKKISSLIEKCIITTDKKERIIYYEELTEKILSLFGEFDINNFDFKSKLDL